MRPWRGLLPTLALCTAATLGTGGCRVDRRFEKRTIGSADAGRRPAFVPGGGDSQCVFEGDPLDVQPMWEGLAGNYAFVPSGSRRIRLGMDENTGQVDWLVVGDGPAVPAPGAEPCYPICLGESVPGWVEGFRYTVRRTDAETGTPPRYQINPYEVWDEWCRARAPVTLASGAVSCATPAPACPGSWATSRDHAPECCFHLLCNEAQVCTCDASGCRHADGAIEFSLYPVNHQRVFEAHDESGVLGVLWPADSGGTPDGGPEDAGLGLL